MTKTERIIVTGVWEKYRLLARRRGEDRMAKFTISVNGQSKSVDVMPDTPLLWVLRDALDMRGTKFGCGVGDCAACTVLMDGKAARSCLLPISEVGKAKVTTIEGLSANGSHAVQQAWVEEDVAQCGYCQGGQILAAVSLLKTKPNPTDADIDAAMKGNLCRCGAYDRIRNAIKRAAKAGVK